MRATNKPHSFLCIGLLLSLNVYAEPSTVDTAIAAAKQKKAQTNAVASASSLPSALLNSNKNTNGLANSSTPKLWSVRGVNDNQVAEIIYESAIHHVPLKLGQKFEKWEITAYNSNSLVLTESSGLYAKRNSAKSSRTPVKTIQLMVPAAGYSIVNYDLSPEIKAKRNLQERLLLDLDTPERRAAASLPAPMPLKN